MEPDTQSYRPELRTPVFWKIARLEKKKTVGSVGVGWGTGMWVHGRGLCYDCGDSVWLWVYIRVTLKEWQCFVKVLERGCVFVCAKLCIYL